MFAISVISADDVRAGANRRVPRESVLRPSGAEPPVHWVGRRLSARPLRRWIVFAALVAICAVALILDGTVGRPAFNATRSAGAAPVSALSSAWFCSLTPAPRANPAAGTVAILNPNNRPITGSATFYPVNGDSRDVPFSVAPLGRAFLHPGDVVDDQFAATVVRVDGGGAGVEHALDAGPAGVAYSPCATSASDHWYIADGSTGSNDSLLMALFNPFLEDAVVDLSFVTSDGPAAPAPFQGVVVPSHKLVVVNVGDELHRRDWITASAIARGGRIVVDALQTGSANGVGGSALVLASPELAQEWYIPDGVVNPGLTDHISLYNPGDEEATADVELILDEGASDPFALHVPANGRASVNFEMEDRIPRNVHYSVRVRSTNGIPVVVEKTATATAPAPYSGVAMTMGALVGSRSWLFVYGATVDPMNESIFLTNTGSRPATVRVMPTGSVVSGAASTGAAGGAGAVSQHIGPGQRLGLPVDSLFAGVTDPSIVVESDQPVVAGREIERAGGPTWMSGLGAPLR